MNSSKNREVLYIGDARWKVRSRGFEHLDIFGLEEHMENLPMAENKRDRVKIPEASRSDRSEGSKKVWRRGVIMVE